MTSSLPRTRNAGSVALQTQTLLEQRKEVAKEEYGSWMDKICCPCMRSIVRRILNLRNVWMVLLAFRISRMFQRSCSRSQIHFLDLLYRKSKLLKICSETIFSRMMLKRRRRALVGNAAP